MNIKDLFVGQKIDVKIDGYRHRGVTISWLSKYKDICEVRYDNNKPTMFTKESDYEITVHDPVTEAVVEGLMSKIDFDFFNVVGGRQCDMHSEVSRHPKDFIRMALEKWIDEDYIKGLDDD